MSGLQHWQTLSLSTWRMWRRGAVHIGRWRSLTLAALPASVLLTASVSLSFTTSPHQRRWMRCTVVVGGVCLFVGLLQEIVTAAVLVLSAIDWLRCWYQPTILRDRCSESVFTAVICDRVMVRVRVKCNSELLEYWALRKSGLQNSRTESNWAKVQVTVNLGTIELHWLLQLCWHLANIYETSSLWGLRFAVLAMTCFFGALCSVSGMYKTSLQGLRTQNIFQWSSY